MIALKRGDVVLVLFPNSDLQSFKRRPALIVQSDEIKTSLPQVLVAMVTSNLDRRAHPSRVFIPLDSSDARTAGFRTDSVIMTDNLATVLLKAVESKIGHLPTMDRVDDALRITLGLGQKS
jgi:mRNA interferase MazF